MLQSEQLKQPSQSDIEIAESVIGNLFYRRDREASLVQAVVHYLEVDTGRLKYSSKVPLPNLNAIGDNFNSEESKRACAHVRNHLNLVFGRFQNDIGDQWARYFWNRGKQLVPLKLNIKIPEMPPEVINHPIIKFSFEYEIHCRTCLIEIWDKLPVDIFESETFEELAKFDSWPSRNPLHKRIWQPFYLERDNEWDIVVNATKYLSKSFTAVKTAFQIKTETQTPYQWLMKKMEQIREEGKQTADK